jgi:hypothetical protein
MVTKMNKTSATHKLQAQLAEGKPVKGGSGSHGKKSVTTKRSSAKGAPAKVASAKVATRPAVSKAKPKSHPVKAKATQKKRKK